MNTFQGTVTNGQIILDNPVKLSEGTRVEVLPIEARQPTVGMREEEWPTTPEGIAALLARMDSLEPGWVAELTRRGRPIGQIDMLIAAIALSLGNTTVVSGDSDLSAVSGLTVQNWAKP